MSWSTWEGERPELRALYVVTAYSRHAGDWITPWLTETIRRLRPQGVEVEVLAPAYRGGGDAVVEGVRVHRYRYAPRSWEDLTHDETAPDRLRRRPWYLTLVPGYVWSGMRAARRLARTGGFDLVHVHWPLPHALHGFAARAATGIPLVCSFYGVELHWARRWPGSRPFLRYVLRNADAVTAISTYTARLIREVYDRPVELIPFGSTVTLDPDAAPAVARPAGSPFRLLFVGRLVERKGVHYLLQALARLRERDPVHLWVVGDGPMRPELEARARELGVDASVTFTGFLTREALAERYRRCDAFVLPAVYDRRGDTEGLGVVLVEALSQGKPVVASAVGGIPDVVRDGETGLLVAPADPDVLARAVRTYLRDPALARAHGQAGRAHVEAHFSWETIIERLTTLYRRLLERRSLAAASDAS